MVEDDISKAAAEIWMIGSDELTITDLLSYRLYLAANAMQRSASRIYKNEFNVSLGEWRALALLAATGPLTLNQLARLAGFDKGQMSRVISGLVDRRLVSRKDSPSGGRAISLDLTKKGLQLHKRIMKAAAERNEAFLSCLSDDEKITLDSALTKLTTVGRAFARQAPKRD